MSIRMRLANSATARKKHTINTGMDIKIHATGSIPPKHSAWKIPVPNRPVTIHQMMDIPLPATRWYNTAAVATKRIAAAG